MAGSPRRFLSAAFLVSGALITLAAGVNSQTSADGLAVYFPDQAILLDGSVDPLSTYAISFTSTGFLVDRGTPLGPLCLGRDHANPGGTTAVLQGLGVWTLLNAVVFPLAVPPVPHLTPVDVATLKSDCQLLANYSSLETYLKEVCEKALAQLALIEACVQDGLSTYCDLVAAIKEAPLPPPSDEIAPNLSVSYAATGGQGLGLDVSFGPCIQNLKMVQGLAQSLDALAARLSACDSLIDSMDLWRKQLLRLGLAEDKKGDALAGADSYLNNLLMLQEEAEDIIEKINAAKAQLTKEKIAEACSSCGNLDFSGLKLSGAVQIDLHRQPIGRFVGALHHASGTTGDRTLASRYTGLAERLAKTPGSRVLHVTYPSTSPISVHLMALSNAPDDGVSPLVVVLTALRRGAPLPQINVDDERLLYAAFRTFRQILAPSGR